MCVEMRLESMVVPIGGNGMEECEGGGGGSRAKWVEQGYSYRR
jgi:hypothetical protein